ncbi:hypothetical protein RDWZM_003278 [Blomia tropicalis]|uniref:Uncharacterized protein n=1 Tax=Blomia tropicalis TaxID=40697 RepID=A0A9Q0MEK1_BLOTA|nr:hypothetical protein RDWZM_003278 [Blomia tropicalis]
MGNLLHRLFSGGSKHRDSKRNSKVNENEVDQTNGVLFRKSFVSPNNESDHQSTSDHISNESPVSNQTPVKSIDSSYSSSPTDDLQAELSKSPFQREFLPPHQMLVSLEKTRPRQSKTRISTRKPILPKTDNNDNVPNPNMHILTSVPSYGQTTLNNHDQFVINAKNHDDNNNKDDDDPDNNNNDNDDVKRRYNESVDEMSPNERQKIARTRLSKMFIQRQQKQVTDSEQNGGMILNSNYVRVYDNVDKYGHYLSSASTVTNDSSQLPSPESFDSIESEPTTEIVKNFDTALNDASSLPPEVVPRRRPMKLGNPMLIDELKKRQSTIQQTID